MSTGAEPEPQEPEVPTGDPPEPQEPTVPEPNDGE